MTRDHYRPSQEPPSDSWWEHAPGPAGFTRYVTETQLERMRGTTTAAVVMGSESGACVSQWRPMADKRAGQWNYE